MLSCWLLCQHRLRICKQFSGEALSCILDPKLRKGWYVTSIFPWRCSPCQLSNPREAFTWPSIHRVSGIIILPETEIICRCSRGCFECRLLSCCNVCVMQGCVFHSCQSGISWMTCWLLPAYWPTNLQSQNLFIFFIGQLAWLVHQRNWVRENLSFYITRARYLSVTCGMHWK